MILLMPASDDTQDRPLRAMISRNLLPLGLLLPFLLALYIGIVYAILYAFFAAFPIVFQETRGFSPGQGGLAFLGVGLGTAIGTALAPLNNRLYWRAMEKSGTGKAPPEA